MKKALKIIGIVLLVLVLSVLFWFHSNLKDRHPGYTADLKITGKPSVLSAGFAAVPITPEVPDKWVDKNNDQKYDPKDGDTFIDGNGNGVFDPVWIAGFSNNKPPSSNNRRPYSSSVRPSSSNTTPLLSTCSKR